MKPYYLLIAPILFLAGCLNNGMEEGTPVFTADVSEIRVPGELGENAADSVFSFSITTNRNWFAQVNVPYARLRTPEGYVLDRQTHTISIDLVFDPNPLNTDRNGLLEIWSEGEKKQVIPIVQEGITYRISANTPNATVGEDGGEGVIAVRCNTAWTAAIGDGSFPGITLDKTSGILSDTVRVQFPESEVTEPRSASVVFTAEDCDPVVVSFTQDAASSQRVPAIKTNFISSGTGVEVVPVMVIDKTGFSDDLLEVVQYHYTMCTTSFDDIKTPTESDQEFLNGGLALLPEGYQTNSTATKTYYEFFIKIAGTAPGYKTTYSKVLVRIWSFGQKYIYNQSTPVSGLSISGVAAGKQTYYIRFATSDNTMTASVAAKMKGDARTVIKCHTQSQTPKIQFLVGDTVLQEKTYSGIVQTDPIIESSPSFEVEEGQIVSVCNPGPKYSYIWTLLLMEECKYKP